MASYPESQNSWATKGQLLASQDSRDALRLSQLPDTQVDPDSLQLLLDQDDVAHDLSDQDGSQHEPSELGQLIHRPHQSLDDIPQSFQFTAFPARPTEPSSTIKRSAALPEASSTAIGPDIPAAPTGLIRAHKSDTVREHPVYANTHQFNLTHEPRQAANLPDMPVPPAFRSDHMLDEVRSEQAAPRVNGQISDNLPREASNGSEGSKSHSRSSTTHSESSSPRLPPQQARLEENNQEISSEHDHEHGHRHEQLHEQNYRGSYDDHSHEGVHQHRYPDFEHERSDQAVHYQVQQAGSHHYPHTQISPQVVAEEQTPLRKHHSRENATPRGQNGDAVLSALSSKIRHHSQVPGTTSESHARSTPKEGHQVQQIHSGEKEIDVPWQSPHPPQRRQRRKGRSEKGSERGSETANRPLGKSQSTQPSLRPGSRGSNISKVRTPLQPPRREAPAESARPRESRPRTKLREAARRNQLTLVDSWNRYFSTHFQSEDAIDEEMHELRSELADCEDMIAKLEKHVDEQAKSHHRQMKDQNSTIKKLRADGTALRDTLTVSEKALAEKDEKFVAVAERCQRYRDCLNKAIAEQQHLYTKTKQNTKTIVSQLMEEFEADKKAKEEIILEIMSKSEESRDKLRKQAELVAQEARHVSMTMNNTIEALKSELAERQRELAQERATSERARVELENNREANTQALQDLSSQNAKILDAINLHQDAKDESLAAIEERDKKLDLLCQSVSDLQQSVNNPSASLSEDIASISEELTNFMATHFQDISSKVSDIDGAQKKHGPKIDEISNACRAIDERMQSEDGVMYWQEMCQESDQSIRLVQEDCRRVQKQADTALLNNQALTSQNEKLVSEVSSLKDEILSLQGKLRAAEDATAIKDGKIQQSLSAKEAKIVELQSKLEHDKLEMERLQHTLQARNDEKVTMTSAHRNEMDELQKQRSDAENKLKASESTRNKLEEELKEAKDQIEQLPQDADIAKLTALLEDDVRMMTELVQGQASYSAKLDDSAAQFYAGEARLAVLARLHDDLSRKFSETNMTRDQLDAVISAHSELIQKINSRSITSAPADSSAIVLPPTSSSEELTRTRRVIVRSPIEEPVPTAPTIEEERNNRRSAAPGKSNLRATTRTASQRLQTDGEGHRAASNGSNAQEQSLVENQPVERGKKSAFFSHSSFNRPVRGDSQRSLAPVNDLSAVKRKRLSNSTAKDSDQQNTSYGTSVGRQARQGSSSGPKLRPKFAGPTDDDDQGEEKAKEEFGEEVKEHSVQNSRIGNDQSRAVHRSSSLTTYGSQNQDPQTRASSLPSQSIGSTAASSSGSKRRRLTSAGP